MTAEERSIQNTLAKAYDRESWKNTLSEVFANVQLFAKPQDVNKSHKDVKAFKQLGNVQLESGEMIALYELAVADNIDLKHNRVSLNGIVSSTIDEIEIDGVIAIFQKETEDYRMTFSAAKTEFDEATEEFIEKSTDPKRYTYFLGENASCKTPALQLAEIQKKKDVSLEDIRYAFNVEEVSKRFFDDYIDQFKVLVDEIISTPSYYAPIFEKEETEVRNFVKRLMGRLVFLKFIEKKGWLGVPAENDNWEDGDYKFLENHFKQAKTNEKADYFVTQFLNPLFYDALNAPDRENNVFIVTNTKIPYLSGGLFEPDTEKEQRVNFKPETLDSLFDFFNQYNFTIDEHDTSDKEVGVDPEMLGRIFENLLEDNKGKGAFYTPKEIVRYMCQESLKEYLKTSFEKDGSWPKDDAEQEKLSNTLAAFVEKKEMAEIASHDKLVATALKEVKICDPAIGSGAFPMGLLNEIFALTKGLHEESPDRVGEVWGMPGKQWDASTVKKNIIQNSIYGVDIEPGAVDIARLRFWLSLIIEEDTPQPLPHLDYKIVVGNSLVSKLEDTIIDIDWQLKGNEQTDLFGNSHTETNRELLKKISRLQAAVFEPKSDEGKLSLELRDLKIDLLISQLELMIATKGLEVNPKGNSRKIKKQTDLWLETKGWQKQIKKLQRMKKTTDTLLRFFNWQLDFPEVMNPEINENPGFDIVIANPPYINIELIDEITKKVLFDKYKFSKGRTDIYIGFIELSIDKILKNKGSVIFIIPFAFVNQNYGKILRDYLIKSTFIKTVVDLTDFYVFENASVKNVIIHLVKKIIEQDTTVIKPKSLKEFNLKTFDFHKINQSIFTELNGSRFETKDIRDLLLLRDKIISSSYELEDICLIAYGARLNSKVDSSRNKSYYLSENKKNGYKPFIEGKNIQRYSHSQNGYLNYSPKEHYNSMFNELFENEKLMFINHWCPVKKAPEIGAFFV